MLHIFMLLCGGPLVESLAGGGEGAGGVCQDPGQPGRARRRLPEVRSYLAVTLAYTPGTLGSAQPDPQLTTPT